MKLSKNQIILLLLLLIGVAGIVLSVGMVRQRQTPSSNAAQATILSFEPVSNASTPIQKQLNDQVSLDIMADPGSNLLSFAKLEITYDATKFTPAATTPFVASTAMPQVIEGPVFQNGRILVALSIGADPTKAISTKTKLATINFRAIGGTTSPAQISYGPTTQVFSIDPNSAPSDNVLSSATPAFVAVAGPVPTATIAVPTSTPQVPTSTPSPTAVPVRIQGTHVNQSGAPVTLPGQQVTVYNATTNAQVASTTASPSWSINGLPRANYRVTVSQISGYTIETNVCSNCTFHPNYNSGSSVVLDFALNPQITYADVGIQYTPVPTLTMTPTPTTPLQSTRLQMTVMLHGIGNSGDNANPTDSTFSNKNPLTTSRPIRVQILDQGLTLVSTVDTTAQYLSSTGGFPVTADLGTVFTTGTYVVKIKIPGYLQKQLPGFFTITNNQLRQLPVTTLVTGDMNDDNKVSLLDYNTLRSCYGSTPLPSCTSTQRQLTDLNDDGNVELADLNLYLREISVQSGD